MCGGYEGPLNVKENWNAQVNKICLLSLAINECPLKHQTLSSWRLLHASIYHTVQVRIWKKNQWSCVLLIGRIISFWQNYTATSISIPSILILTASSLTFGGHTKKKYEVVSCVLVKVSFESLPLSSLGSKTVISACSVLHTSSHTTSES